MTRPPQQAPIRVFEPRSGGNVKIVMTGGTGYAVLLLGSAAVKAVTVIFDNRAIRHWVRRG